MPEDLLAAAADARLGPLLLSAAPAWLFATDGRRVIWANPAGIAFLGESTLESLRNRQFQPGAPSVRQIEALAQRLVVGADAKLALLRFATASSSRLVSALCRKLRFADAEAVLVVSAATEGVRLAPPDALRRAAEHLLPQAAAAVLGSDGIIHWRSPAWEADIAPLLTDAAEVLPKLAREAADGARASRLVAHHRIEAVRVAGDGGPLYLALASSASEDRPVATGPAERIGREHETAPPATPHRPHRFTWRMDEELRFAAVSPELAAMVGASHAVIAGKSWAEIAGRGLDPEGHVAQALVRRDAWTADVRWPSEGGALVSIELAGLPLFDAEQKFLGYRGFGVCRTAHPGSHAPAREVVPTAPAPEAASAPPDASGRLMQHEHEAFREIARALTAEVEADSRTPDAPSADDAAQAVPESKAVDDRPSAQNDTRHAPPVAAEPASGSRSERPEPGGETARLMPASSDDLPSAFAPAADTALLDRLSLGVMIVQDGQVAFANRRMLALFGYRDAKAVNAAGGIAALFEEGAPRESDALRESGAPGEGNAAGESDGDETRPVRARMADGGRLDVDARLFTLDWQGAPGLLLTVEPARRPARPSAQPASADEILDAIIDGVAVVGGNGNVQRVNAELVELVGRPAEELVGRPLPNLFTSDSRFVVLERLNRALRQSGRASELADAEIRGAQGRIPVRVSVGRIGTEAGRLAVVIRDGRERLELLGDAADARRRAEDIRRRGAGLLERISHSIRTPLNVIAGFAELIADQRFGPSNDERYRAAAADIKASGQELVGLLDDIAKLAQIESGAAQLGFRTVSLNDIVEQSVRQLQHEAQRNRILVRTSLAQAAPKLRADEPGLRRVVLHLLTQAMRASRNGGQVIVSTGLGEPGRALLRVRSSGGASADGASRGAPPIEIRETVSPLDSGIGLPLAQAVIEAHRGSLTVENQAGAGILVEISLPAEPVAVLKANPA